MIAPSAVAIEGLVAVIAGWMERRDRVAVTDVSPAVADDPSRLSRRPGEVGEPTVAPPLALPAE